MVTTKSSTTIAIASTTTSSASTGSLSPSPSSSTMAAPAQPTASGRQRKKPGPKPKAEKPSLIVKLKLPVEILTRIPKSALAEPVTAVATPTGSEPSPQPEVAATGTLTPGTKRKGGVPGPKPGIKRSRIAGAAPSKPGRKKAKLDPNAPANPLSTGSKLGPKANTGAINDKLRALDRSGKPCKRWAKAGFQIKSFTGTLWTVPTWAAPKQRPQVDENGSATVSVSENASVTTEASPNEDKMQLDALGNPGNHPAPVIPTLQMSPAGITV